jgi:GT2 family glycosyltransferase
MSLRIAVGIATTGRPAVLAETLRELRSQTRQPDRILVCCAKPADIAALDSQARGVEVVLSAPGSTTQRNRIFDLARDCDLIVFFDDDFLPHPAYLDVMERLFLQRPGTVVATGHVLADGACGPGLSLAEGRAVLQADEFSGCPLDAKSTHNGYGCNMAVRADAVFRYGIRFDERLPLYGWQEDSDLSRRLAPHGDVLLVEGARGVHLGVKQGRTSGLRFGYSQVANPIYITGQTRSYSMKHAITQIARNMAANLLHAITPEPWVDRRGRLHGNLIAIADLLRGRLDPERILEFGTQHAVPRRRTRAPARRQIGAQLPAQRGLV